MMHGVPELHEFDLASLQELQGLFQEVAVPCIDEAVVVLQNQYLLPVCGADRQFQTGLDAYVLERDAGSVAITFR
ncbi:MAG: hypothetical protein D6786_01675 [Gammaproteobacteria bacterium]|nr:MAG: hypothetical protein D6786_01675 [Gammaproteobacteria bacterium]